MRLTSRQRRPLAAGVAMAAVWGGADASDGLGHGVGTALACLGATAFVVACTWYADRDLRRSEG